MKIAGYHAECGSYGLSSDDDGRVNCGGCGAKDLLPEVEALAVANGSIDRFDEFVQRFYHEVKAGARS